MKRNREHLDIFAMAILVVLCASWGFQQITIKVAITGIPPILQAGIRSMGACLLVYLWMLLRKDKLLAKDGTLWWGIAIGLIFSIEFVLIYWGLKFTYASRSVIFLYTMPFLTALGAHLFIPAERMRTSQVVGLCCAFSGILLAFSESIGLPDSRVLIGDIMLLFAATQWAAATVIIKVSPLSKITASKTLLYQLGISAIILPLFSIFLGESQALQLTPLVVGCVLFQVVWVAFITYLAWFWLVNVYPASRLSSFLFLTPLFGVLEGAMVLGETVTRKLFVALILVSIGIYVVNRRNGRRTSIQRPESK